MPNYDRPAFDPEVAESLRRPMKGEFLLERRETRKTLVDAEDAQKDLVRLRDRRCRWPHCEICRRYKDLIPQASHVQAKGMSGDRLMQRSQANQMILLDPITHAQQEKHEKDVVPIDVAQGTDGPCEFWAEDENQQKYLVARETAPFVYERD